MFFTISNVMKHCFLLANLPVGSFPENINFRPLKSAHPTVMLKGVIDHRNRNSNIYVQLKSVYGPLKRKF